ncbi:hypothetical protein EG68_10190 [Paragonimus skrjabini miyazakii]|uniref:RRM domain-containing protein n=1 Tax=Paragonimus skrjabini miyazakii TaxID=59628 RepID=A0A8S9YBC9_9TREM|nr:hypothetical protein EG68_10190 [Paragonimus skrjabini miyazakii]
MTISIVEKAKPKVGGIGNSTKKKTPSKSVEFGLKKQDTKSATADNSEPTTLSNKKKRTKHASAKEKSSAPASKSEGISAGLQKRLSKRAILKSSKPKVNQGSTCLLLLPAAKRLQLYKKSSKRHAFATFATTEDCQKARKQLEGLSIDDFKIRVTFVAPRLLTSEKAIGNQSDSIPLDQTITLSNLPFAATKAQLEEEFPTATEIILNTNKHGRFRGSCLLKFESVDDCKVTLDACRGKKIGGRPVKCRVGTYFTTVPKSQKPICGVKVKHVPVAVEDSQLKALFPNDVLLKFRSNLDATKSSRTVVFIFRDRNAQKAALGRFNSELLFGLRLSARPWTPRSKQKTKPIYDSNEKSAECQSSGQASLAARGFVNDNQSDSVPVVPDTEATPCSSKKSRTLLETSVVTNEEEQHKAKKHKTFSQPDSAETHHVILTPGTPNKPKKRRISDMDETAYSVQKETCDVEHGAKKHKRLSLSSSAYLPDKTMLSPQLHAQQTDLMRTPKSTPTTGGIKSANSSVVTSGSKEKKKKNGMTGQVITPSFGDLKKKKDELTEPGVTSSFASPSLTSSSKKKQHKRTFSNISSP